MNLYGPSPGLSKFLNLRQVSVIETGFDPELAAMVGLPVKANTNVFVN